MTQYVFTTVAKNYLSQAAILFNSAATRCPDAVFICFVIDGFDDLGEIPPALRENVIDCRTLRIDNFDELSFKYTVTEFATSLKPHLFEYMFRTYKCSYVVFFDPDTKLYSDLDWIDEEIGDKSILMSPHLLDWRPYSSSYNGALPDLGLDKYLRVGFYNTGFMAIRDDDYGRDFVRLWGEILENSSLREYCYDQSWAELVSNFFRTHVGVVFDAGANVAIWNIHERTLTRDSQSNYFVNGGRLKFMHFTKIDKFFETGENKRRKRRNAERNKNMLDSLGYLDLYEEYIRELQDTEFGSRKKIAYRYACFDNGRPIAAFVRRIYLESVISNIAIRGDLFSDRGDMYKLVESLGWTKRHNRYRSYASKFLFRVIRRLVSSKLIFRFLGAEGYSSLIENIKSMTEDGGMEKRALVLAGHQEKVTRTKKPRFQAN